MKKTIIILGLMISFITVTSVEARLLPRFRSSGTANKSASSGLVVYPRLRGDRQALEVTFSNLQKVTSITYTLIYQTYGIDQGVSGTLDSSSGNSVSRELLFGTCSSGTCRYHQSITNMKLEITSQLPSGKQTIRRFRIRV